MTLGPGNHKGFLVLYFAVIYGVSAIDDFTCVTKPRISISTNDAENTYIASYFAGNALPETSLTFRRTIDTFTNDANLPPGISHQRLETTGAETIRVLQMPGGIPNIGAFTCEAENSAGDITSIGTVIMSRRADFLPRHASLTVNTGDTVNLTVTARNPARTLTRWRKDAGDPVLSRNDHLYFDISDVSQADSGIYETHFMGERRQGEQALMRLIVRGCQENIWSVPSCDVNCPVCFNGGICTAQSGVCICPPGFSGDFCEILLGPDRFGQGGSFRCSSFELLNSMCRGKLFCLPDPFGCSCASGYHGLDCTTECTDGSFGANCAQICHCLDGDVCNKSTGRCPGDCASGYKGINCQDSCAASMGGLAGDCTTQCAGPDQVTELRDVTPTASAASQIHLSWKFVSNRCAVNRYKVQYQLRNQGQCLLVGPPRVNVTSGADNYYADSLEIATNVLPYSTYIVYITAWNEIGEGPETELSIQTGESVPTAAPEFLNSSPIFSRDAFISWNPVPCGSRGGLITGYTYELRDITGNVIPSHPVTTETTAITGLTPCTNYTFRVRAHTSKGNGPWMDDVTIRTIPEAPGKVTNLAATGTSVTTQLMATWQEPHDNCPFEYTVEYALINRDTCLAIVLPTRQRWLAGSQPPVTISGLHPNSIYRVYVTIERGADSGEEVFTEAITQSTAPTGPPSNVTVSNATESSLSFSWAKPQCGFRNGNITTYNYTLTNVVTSSLVKEATVEATFADLRDLDPFTVYSLAVSAGNDFGFGPVASNTGRTGRLGKPDFLVVSAISQTSIALSWIPTQYPNEKIVKYVIANRVISRPYDQSFSFDSKSNFESQDILNTSARSGTVNGLEPSTQYEFQVYFISNNDTESERATVRQFTAVATDLPSPEIGVLSNQEITSTFITITLSTTSTSKYITSYLVGVENTNTATSQRSRKSAPQFTSYAEDPSSYIAAEFPWSLPEEFVVGDDKTYGGYYNPSLRKGDIYQIYIGAVSRINATVANVAWNKEPLIVEVTDGSSSRSPPVGIWIALALVLIIVTLILVAVVIWKRRQRNATNRKNAQLQATSEPQINMDAIEGLENQYDDLCGPPSSSASRPQPHDRTQAKSKHGLPAKTERAIISAEGPVPLSNLADYIKNKKSTKNGFQMDYESMSSEPLYPWIVAKKKENTRKNRYTNIIAYDHSRVVLECLDDDPHSDYINASYIHGYKQDNQYIACQGPNKASLSDIWRMVWQEQVGTIVMLTNLVENGKTKCQKYWPDDCQTFIDICVNKVNEETHTNYVVRTFHISKRSEPEGVYRIVTQYHYTTWPDMKPPESSSLLQFVRRVQTAETFQSGPIVVHCSAGVGRTGTFITLDAMLEQAQAEDQVDVHNFVRCMRDQRIMMVQTLDQYKFIFDALLESRLTENTAIPANRLQHDFTKLKKRDRKTGTTGIEDQFVMLETFAAEFNEEKYRGGRESVNLDKNRFQDSIPADKSRPYLMTAGEDGSTNYINATFLDGYQAKSAYLATQAPLPNTVADIWRMVFDYKSTCIVMLNAMDNDPNVPQYWPDEGSKYFGPLKVTFKGVDFRNDAVIVRQFGLDDGDRMNEGEQTICHIQYLGWPTGKEVPSSPSSLLKVLEAVRMWTHDHPDGPITVHCIDGLGRSGTFCALMTVLNNIRHEQVLDVFQAVKKLRETRAGMVATLAQYQLCYQVTQHYLDSTSIYVNLR